MNYIIFTMIWVSKIYNKKLNYKTFQHIKAAQNTFVQKRWWKNVGEIDNENWKCQLHFTNTLQAAFFTSIIMLCYFKIQTKIVF